MKNTKTISVLIVLFLMSIHPLLGAISGTTPICQATTTTWTTDIVGATWSSDNALVATINSTTGVITAVGGGTCVITATDGTTTDTKSLTVIALTPQTILGTSPLCVGSLDTYTSTTSGGTWGSNNGGIASINSSTGEVTGVSAGATTITYSVTVNGCDNSSNKPITITAPIAQNISGISPMCITATNTWTRATAGGMWSSDDTGIATVNGSGLVAGVSPGTANITYTVTVGGCVNTDTKPVTITAPIAQNISGTSPMCLTATNTWSKTTAGGTWSSNNTGIATVNGSGLVAGVSAGTANITYSVTVGGCVNTDTKSVTITSPIVQTITGASSICMGSNNLWASTTAGGTWTSGNNAIATVDGAGLVTGVSSGTTNINYSVTAGGCVNTANKTVNITVPVLSGTISDGSKNDESNIIDGGSTIVITFANETWVDFVANPTEVDNLLDGITGNKSWYLVRPFLSSANVVRTSASVVTITLPPVISYSISSDETLSINVPLSAIGKGAGSVAASTTLTIVDQNIPTITLGGTIFDGTQNKESNIRAGLLSTITFTISGDKWVSTWTGNDAMQNEFLDSIKGDKKWYEVRAKIDQDYISRSNDRYVITLKDIPAVPNYIITSDETLTITIPANATESWGKPIKLQTKLKIIAESTLPTGTIVGSGERCAGSTNPIPLFFMLTGKAPWNVKYTKNGGNETSLIINSSPYSINITNATDSVFKLSEVKDADGMIATSLMGEAKIKINQLPTVSIQPSGSQNYSVTRDSIQLIGTPPGGIYSGAGVTSNDSLFHPKYLHINDVVTVTYSYTNSKGCNNKTTAQYTILTGSEEIRFPKNRTQYCNTEKPDTIIGINNQAIDGIFSYSIDNGVTWIPTSIGGFIEKIGVNKIKFYPSKVSQGEYKIRYVGSIINPWPFPPTIFFDLISNITILKNPKGIDFDYTAARCVNSSDTVFIGKNMNPPGGKGYFFYNGPAAGLINDSNIYRATLKPSLAKANNYLVSFYYKTPDGCLSDTATKPLIIHSKPKVDFTMNDYYNSKLPIDTFKATPSGITSKFPDIYIIDQGNGIAKFKSGYPAGEYLITYSYINANGCYGDTTKKMTILDPKGDITGIDNYYCIFGGKSDTLKGLIQETLGSPSFVQFEINGKLATKLTDSTIIINPTLMHADTNTISLIYKIGTIPFTITKDIKIDSIGDFIFGTDLISSYCKNDGIVNLAPIPPTDNGGQGIHSMLGSGTTVDNKFNPTQAKLGIDTIYCTFTRSKSGCKKTLYKTTLIKKLPFPKFVIDDKCITGNSLDSSIFMNTTSEPDSVIKWQWEFGDVGSGFKNFDSIISPKHYYRAPGRTDVKLSAIRNNGCVNDTAIQFSLGQKPVANFYWINDCFTNDSIEFVDSTVSSSLFTETHNWRFFINSKTDTIIKTKNTHINYFYPTQSDYRVDLVIITSELCRDSVSKVVHLRPTLTIADTAATPYYYQNFNKGPGDWFPASDASGSWTFGLVDSILGKTDSAYFTKATNNLTERSYVISPCFDLKGLERPIIKMNIKRSFERNRNGAVLQFSNDNGKNWLNIGNDLNDGINWYNSFSIMTGNNGPGGQSIGWTNEEGSFSPDTSWIEARQILKIVNKSGVRFRIAYASEGGTMNKDMNGFAFDNFWLGSRSRRVLIEHITNTSGLLESPQDQILNAVIDTANPKDVIDIRYHLNYPNDDPYFKDETAAPLARALYYGIAAPTASIIDGGIDNSRFNYINGNKINSSSLNIRLLQNPIFNIFINSEINNGELNIKTKILAIDSLTKREVTLHVVVIEKQIDNSSGAKFRNVVKQMLPDAAGTSFIKSWSAGESRINEMNWKMSNVYNPGMIKIVAFVQDEFTKEVLQASVYDSTTFFNTIKTINNLDFVIFPNPSTNFVNVIFNKADKHSSVTISIYNTLGILIKTQHIDESIDFTTIDVSDITSGVYLIKVTDNKNTIGIQKLIVE